MTFYNEITFDNIDKARVVLKKLKNKEFVDMVACMSDRDELIKELEQKIKEYEEFVEKDLDSALKYERVKK